MMLELLPDHASLYTCYGGRLNTQFNVYYTLFKHLYTTHKYDEFMHFKHDLKHCFILRKKTRLNNKYYFNDTHILLSRMYTIQYKFLHTLS